MNENIIYWNPGLTLYEIEKICILKSYAHFRQNKTAAANALGISQRTLYEKLARYQEDDEKALEMRRADELKRERDLKRARGLPLDDEFTAPIETTKIEPTADYEMPPKKELKMGSIGKAIMQRG